MILINIIFYNSLTHPIFLYSLKDNFLYNNDCYTTLQLNIVARFFF